MTMQTLNDDILFASIRQRLKVLPHISSVSEADGGPSSTYGNGQKQQRGRREIDNEAVWNRVEQKSTLAGEIETQYGHTGRDIATKNYRPKRHARHEPKIIDTILNNRLKQYTEKQNEHANKIKQLLAERDRLEFQRKKFQSSKPDWNPYPTLSFTMSGGSSSVPLSIASDERFVPSREDVTQGTSVHGVSSFIKHTNNTLPAQIARYNKLRDQIVRDYKRRTVPYDGHLGPHSYQPYQLETYHMVRGIVEEVVDHFLDDYFRDLPPALNRETQQAIIDAQSRQWEKQRQEMMKNEVIQLTMEEIVLLMTKTMTEECVEEFRDMYDYIHNRSNMTFMKLSEMATTQEETGRKVTDPSYDLVTKAFSATQDQKSQNTSNTWLHSQPLTTRGDPTSKPKKTFQAIGGMVLLMNKITPMTGRSYSPKRDGTDDQILVKETYSHFADMELKYWKEFHANITTISVAGRCRGVMTCVVCPNHTLMAIGTTLGDVLVYSLKHRPYRPLRAVSRTGEEDIRVVALAWSLDSSQIISCSEQGRVTIWSVTRESADVDSNKLLTREIQMDPKQLVIQNGPLAEAAEESKPILGAFYPSITPLASQHQVCVAMATGDVIKYDLDRILHGDPNQQQAQLESDASCQHNLETSESLSTTGAGVPVELYRFHKEPVIMLGYIDHINDMVTVDAGGAICIWKSSNEQRSVFGFISPSTKFQLDLSKEMYTPNPHANPHVVFRERSKQPTEGVQRTRQVIAMERFNAEETLAQFALGDPWHEELLENQNLITRVFAPPGPINKSGAVFHLTIRHSDTGLLYTYLTQIYMPVSVDASRIVSCQQSATGDFLCFVLLFPQYSPKDAHLCVILFDLHLLTLRDFSCDIPLADKTLYDVCLNKDAVSCQVSPPVDVTGNSYLFINVNGDVAAYSLITGLAVLKIADPKSATGFPGCVISAKNMDICAGSKMAITLANNQMTILFYTADQRQKSRYLSHVTAVELKDDNTESHRLRMRSAFQHWYDRPQLPAIEQSLVLRDYSPKSFNPAAYIQQLLYELIDDIIIGKLDLDRAEVENPEITEHRIRNESIRQQKTQTENVYVSAVEDSISEKTLTKLASMNVNERKSSLLNYIYITHSQ